MLGCCFYYVGIVVLSVCFVMWCGCSLGDVRFHG